eukprot:SAG31_NODE_13255_length_882_cov_0.989783_1_plen_50_part_10
MLRKVFITGLIIFVKPGSLLQVIVALLSSLLIVNPNQSQSIPINPNQSQS